MELPEQSQPKGLGLDRFLKGNELFVGIFFLGIILLGLGVLGFKFFSLTSNEPKIEILGESSSPSFSTNSPTIIVVEAAGEVQKPGVYELSDGSRINDLLILAGGLSAEADRDWVERNINMAAKLNDGAKIYIPSITQSSNVIPSSAGQNQNLNLKIGETKINMNTASESELDSLWGVGPATAKKIIEGRPYQKTEDLLEKKIIKSNVWEKIKDEIAVY